LTRHYHGTVDQIILTGVYAVIFINLVRIAAVHAGKQPGPIGTVGRAVGALVTFGA
jgi:hypothetical protein